MSQRTISHRRGAFGFGVMRHRRPRDVDRTDAVRHTDHSRACARRIVMWIEKATEQLLAPGAVISWSFRTACSIRSAVAKRCKHRGILELVNTWR